ncbi:arylsulfatase [Pseudomonas yamanorum]|uniref:arylsulfatase n=1 Tax=Pseudomonas yamanorum TaxID=515393 RepID=UPI0015A1308B|nr:arylsulfatase [Pseudomonas yamanorum]NVZ92692.1 arylsulfatase [Pseudomonas yamanorum]
MNPTKRITWAPFTSRDYLMTGPALLLLAGAVQGEQSLPEQPEPFQGKLGLTTKDSAKPQFSAVPSAPKGAPNVLIVLLDDVGFSAASTFGGPVNTPTLEALANRGLRYTQFHTTALCSPTRAALLSGRNHHSVHTGQIMEMATGYPGYDSMVGKDTTGIGTIMRDNGWNTAWIGKDHNVPDWETSQAGPFDRWPTGLGFERFYGFIGGDMNQWRALVFDGTQPIEPYVGKPDYNLDYDLADQAIKYLHMQHAVAPDKPFLLYYAPGATHAPHHPRKEWVEKYKGQFDIGWDKLREQTFARQKQLGIIPQDTQLTARPDSIPAWDSLSPDQKKLYARMMEIYAGYLEQTDYNVGRVEKAIDDMGLRENTIVLYIVGDNGASAEAGLGGATNLEAAMNGVVPTTEQMLTQIDDLGTWKTYNHYPVGWAHAMDTPFQWTKQIASHYGGTRNGMVISWPGHIKDEGGIRTQWHHVIDILPTVLDVTKVQAPTSVEGIKQRPIEGVSMAYTFDQPKTASTRKTQYFELFGNRAIYHDGWVAATTPVAAPWSTSVPDVDVITGYNWELYHVDKDFSEANDVAKQMPDKLKEMQQLFYAEAEKYKVLPLNNDRVMRLNPINRPSLSPGRTSFTYYAGSKRIPEGVAPDIKNKSWSLTANVEIPANGAEGMIATLGGLFDGWALYLDKGKPVFHYNFGNIGHTSISAPQALTAGKHKVVMDFKYDGGGMGKGGVATLYVDDQQVAQGRIEHTVAVRFTMSVETFDIGEDTGTPVNLSYEVPFAFTGRIDDVTIKLVPPPPETAKAHLLIKQKAAQLAVERQ